MLKITVPACEKFDEANSRFITIKEHQLTLEHSLVSISKWESKWHKPFFEDKPKTFEESQDYVRCMTLTQNVDPLVYLCLTSQNYKEINDYIEDPMTATWINERNTPGHSKETITSELIYYWMIAFNIPIECQKWHISRLIMLIRICNVKNQPPKKMSKSEILSRNRSLNAARRKALGTKG